MSSKCKKMGLCSIAIIIVLIMIVIIRNACFKPDYIKEIRNNHVYLCGFYGRYPKNHQQRFYIEFKKNKTFILMDDCSRGTIDDYDQDGDGSHPHIKIIYGKYVIDRNNRYILSKAKSAYVEFKDVGAVNSNEINYYYTRTFSQYEVMTERVFTNDKGNYILSRTSMDKKAIDKKWYYYIYNKSDIKKLPSSPEEFRKQFKMDKKAEQERLAEQAR